MEIGGDGGRWVEKGGGGYGSRLQGGVEMGEEMKRGWG